MNWQVIAWTLGALSMVVALISAVVELVLRKFEAEDLATYLPWVQGGMSVAGVVAFALALVFDPVEGMTENITAAAIALVVSGSSVYVVLVIGLAALKSQRAKRRASN